MYCTNCGKEIAEGSKFCTYCGAKVQQSPEPPVSPITPINPIPKKKSLLAIWIVLTVLLLATLGGVLYYAHLTRVSSQLELEEAEQTRRDAERARREAEWKTEDARKAQEQAQLEAEAAEQARLEAERKAAAEMQKAKANEDRRKKEAAKKMSQPEPPALIEELEIIDPLEEEYDENTIYERVEKSAEFPGGQQAMMRFLGNNVKYPVVALEKGIQGKVICQFTINKDGSIEDIEVVRSSGDASLDKEAVRLIKTMPNWKPGEQRGKAVRSKFTLPVVFRLQS